MLIKYMPIKILITGATGFIGTNLINSLRDKYTGCTLLLANSKTTGQQLNEFAKVCDAVFYLAAVHRSNNDEDFKRYNCDLLKNFLGYLEDAENRCPIIFTSSRQASADSPYGQSKIDAEKLIWEHANKHAASSVVYRLTNTFGRHARPYGHSVVATFCYNIQRNIPIVVNNPDTVMHFYYIDDVVISLMSKMDECIVGDSHAKDNNIYRISAELIYSITLGELASKLYSFKYARDKHIVPDAETLFDQRLLYTFDGYSPDL